MFAEAPVARRSNTGRGLGHLSKMLSLVRTCGYLVINKGDDAQEALGRRG